MRCAFDTFDTWVHGMNSRSAVMPNGRAASQNAAYDCVRRSSSGSSPATRTALAPSAPATSRNFAYFATSKPASMRTMSTSKTRMPLSLQRFAVSRTIAGSSMIGGP